MGLPRAWLLLLLLNAHLALAQELQRWLDSLTIVSNRLILQLYSGHPTDAEAHGTPSMSVDLRRIRCSGIRLGYPGSTGALASHVIEHESPGPADLLTRTARLVLKFEQADFRCHFSSVDVRNGWAHPRPAHGDDSVTLVLPEAKYAIVHTLVGAVAEDVAIDVSDVKGEIHLQLDVDSEGMPAGISVPFTRVRAPTTGIIVRVGFTLTDFLVTPFIHTFGLLLEWLVTAFISDLLAYFVEQRAADAIRVLREHLIPYLSSTPTPFSEIALEGVTRWADMLHSTPIARLLNETLSQPQQTAAITNRLVRAVAAFFSERAISNAPRYRNPIGSIRTLLEDEHTTAGIQPAQPHQRDGIATRRDSSTAPVPEEGGYGISMPSSFRSALSGVELNLPRLGTVTLDVTEGTLDGLDSFEILQLKMVDEVSLRAAFQLRHLKARLRVHVELQESRESKDAVLVLGAPADFDCSCVWTEQFACPMDPPGAKGWAVDDRSPCFRHCCVRPTPFSDQYTVDVVVHNIKLDATIQLGFNFSAIRHLQWQQLLADPRCLLHAVPGLGLRALKFELAPMNFALSRPSSGSSPHGSTLTHLDDQIADVINNAFKLLSTTMGRSIPRVLRALSSGPVTEALAFPSQIIESLSEAAHCPHLPNELPRHLGAPYANFSRETPLSLGTVLHRDADAGSPYTDWRDSELLGRLHALFTPSNTNRALQELSGDDGRIEVPRQWLDHFGHASIELPLAEHYRLGLGLVPCTARLRNISISGLHSFYAIDVLRADSNVGALVHNVWGVGGQQRRGNGDTRNVAFFPPRQLANFSGNTFVSADELAPFELNFTVNVEILSQNFVWEGGVHVAGADFAVDLLVELLGGLLPTMTTGESISVCALEPLHLARIADFVLYFDRFDVWLRAGGNTTSVSGNSPRSVYHLRTAAIRRVLGLLQNGAIQFLNAFVSQRVRDMHAQCAARSASVFFSEPVSGAPSSLELLEERRSAEAWVGYMMVATILTVTGVMIGALMLLSLLDTKPVRESSRPWQSLDATSWPSPDAPWLDESRRLSASSLASRYPFWMCCCMTAGLIVCLALLGYGYTWPAASISVDVTVAGEALPTIDVFSFTIVNSALRFYEIGWSGYPMAAAIFIGAGVYPSVKCLLNIFAIWAPSALLPARLRRLGLLFLDFVGKWSLLEATITMMAMATNNGLRIDLPLEDIRNGKSPVLQTRFHLVPREGLFYFMFSYLLLLALSAAVLHMHMSVDLALLRQQVEAAHAAGIVAKGQKCVDGLPGPDERNGLAFSGRISGVARAGVDGQRCDDRGLEARRGAPALLRSHTFSHFLGLDWISHRWKLSLTQQLLLTLGLVFSTVGSVASIFLGCVETQSVGLVDEMMLDNNPHKRRSWSLWSMWQSMRALAEDSSAGMGTHFLAWCFIAFLLIAPVLWLSACVILWCIPLRVGMRHHLVFVARLCWSFSCSEVFFTTMVIALMGLGPILHQMMVDKSETIDELILLYFDELVPVPTILGVARVALLPGFFLFGASVLTSVYFGVFVMLAAEEMNRDIYMNLSGLELNVSHVLDASLVGLDKPPVEMDYGGARRKDGETHRPWSRGGVGGSRLQNFRVVIGSSWIFQICIRLLQRLQGKAVSGTMHHTREPHCSRGSSTVLM